MTSEQVASRAGEHGPNELIELGGRGPWRILWEQLSGAMVLMLIVAAIVSGVLGEYTDAIVIMGIVVLNAALGFVQVLSNAYDPRAAQPDIRAVWLVPSR